MKHTYGMTAAALAITAATAFAGGVSAATLQIANMSAAWSNPTGGSAVVIDNTNAHLPTIRWGTPATGSPGKSGYDLSIPLDPAPQPAATAGNRFTIANFTHINNPILSGGGITGVDLTISGDIQIDGSNAVTGAAFKFLFAHEETPNTANNCEFPPQTGPGACPDIVTVSLLNDTSIFNFNGQDFTLKIDGFRQNDVFTPVFISPENSTNTGDLRATFTVAPSPVPLPAAGWLLLAGLGALGALRRFRKT